MANGPSTDALDDRIDELAQSVRRRRIVAGLAGTVLAGVAAAFLAAALDALLDLSSAVRTVLELLWFALVLGLGWRFAARPWIADPPVDEVAERMMADDSPNVVAALAREARDHHAFPAWPATALAIGAACSLFVALGLAANSGERVRRLALPWHRPAVAAPFEIVVVTGEAVARRGEPITLTAYIKPRDPNATPPDTAVLRLRDSETPMTGANGAYHATLPATDADFDYRIEIGSQSSDWFTVRIADAVELDPGSTVRVVPPDYLAGAVKPKVVPFADLDAMQYSTATVSLKFTRPAESAVLEWRPDGRNPFEAADTFPVALAPDRRSGSATLPLRSHGMLRAVLSNEAGSRRLRTETAIGIRVTTDEPPSFERIEGLAAKPRTARPGQEIRVLFVATDDFAIASAALEHERGSVPLLLENTGTPRAEGRAVITAPSKAGETIRYRLRVRDSRRAPGENLLAREVVFPPNGWFEIKADASGPPIHEQQIIGHRDELRESLNEVREKVEASKGVVDQVRPDSAAVGTLPVDQALRLADTRERLREAGATLNEAAKRASLTIELRPVAAVVLRAVDPLREADDALRLAATDDSRLRAAKLGDAFRHLEAALANLDRIAAANDRLAQDRLDRSRLAELERRQSALAEEPIGDREAAAKAERELLAELKRVVAESENLSRSMAAISSSESARAFGMVRALLADLRSLDAAALQLHAGLRAARLEERAATQLDLVRRIEELAKRLDGPSRIAALARPKREDFERIAALLRKDRVVEALVELERAAAGLEKLASECEAMANDRTDAKLAAAQFAKWQADVRTRHLADRKAPLIPEQAAIAEAAERLHVPAELASLRDAVLVHAKLAKRRLELDAAEADIAMKLAVEAFERLGAKMPTMADRLARARTDLDKLRLEHDAIITGTERVLQPFDKLPLTANVMANIGVKLEAFRVRESRLADRLAALDLPRHESRQARAVRSLKHAVADLKDGLPLDAVASLGAARRELDRLKQALENQTPADARSAEFAVKQAEALRLVLAAGEAATVKQWEPVIAIQQELAAGIAGLLAPEAPAALHEAREAIRLADASLRDGSKFEEIVRRMRDAKEATERLADRLNDREPERARVRSWVAARRTAECAAKKQAGKPLNPDASNVARDELKRELDELLMARVGAAAQAAKKKCFEAYLRLQNRPEPDRQAAEQKQLADALAELASLMGEAPELTTRPDMFGPATDPAEAYLPGRGHAASHREVARAERELRDAVNGVAASVSEALKPSGANPFSPLEAKQRAVAEAAARLMPGSPFWTAVRTRLGAEAARLAADRLAVGDVNGAREAAHRANRHGVEGQDAIVADLDSFHASSNMIAAQLAARHVALADRARESRLRFETMIADTAAPDPRWSHAIEALRQAERSLLEANRKGHDEAASIRKNASMHLSQAAPREGPAAAPAEADPRAIALHDAERALSRAIRELGPKSDPTRASASIRAAADALKASLEFR